MKKLPIIALAIIAAAILSKSRAETIVVDSMPTNLGTNNPTLIVVIQPYRSMQHPKWPADPEPLRPGLAIYANPDGGYWYDDRAVDYARN